MALKEVTDKNLLNQLNQGNNDYPRKKLRLVTDKSLLNELNDKEENNNLLNKIKEFGEQGLKFNLAIKPNIVAGLTGNKTIKNIAEGLGREISGTESMAPTSGRMIGESLPFIAMEGPIAASPLLGLIKNEILKRMGASAITTGAQAISQSPENIGRSASLGSVLGAGVTGLTSLAGKLGPLFGLPIRSGIGGAIGYELGGPEGAGIGAVSAGSLPYIIPSISKNLGQKAMLEGVDINAGIPKIEAAERLGLNYITPAEATGSPFIGAAQGSVGRTGEGSQLMYEKSQGRLSSERKAISSLFDKIYKKDELDPVLKKLYEESFNKNIPLEFLDQLKNSDIINSAFNKVSRDPVYKDKLKNIPENNYAYLDQVKRTLDDMRQVALRKGENDRAKLINQQTKNLTNEMDKLNPEYAQARSLAQRDIVRKKLISGLNDKDIRGTNFYNKFLKNDNNFNKLISSLDNVPEAQQILKDMKLVFQDLINPQTARTAAGLTKTGMTEGRSSQTAFLDFIKSLNGRRYDTAAIELITNPKWHEEFNNIMGINDKTLRAINFSNLISKLSYQPIAEAMKGEK